MKAEQKSLVAVAMSGGVDSAVAAALLEEQGYPLLGVTMRLPEAYELKQSGETVFSETPAPSYITDARLVADKLGIKHLVVDVRQAFREQIVEYFCAEYRAGRTPNPCVFCNPQIKFGILFEHAQRYGGLLLATGHYVQKIYQPETQRYALQVSNNTTKDQSYFLYRLTQAQLAHALFPLANLSKEAIRQKAREVGLHHIAEKAESQENCFLAGQRYQQFLEDYLPSDVNSPGLIVDTRGHILGEHQGIHHYTIGQRRGLGIALGAPRYVVKIDPKTHTVVIGENHELFSSKFLVTHLNFIAIERVTEPIKVQVKIRYRNAATPATVFPGDHEDEVLVALERPQRAVTPGQSAVFYDGDLVVGGGVITSRLD
ncbi:tRNA-specific 2-thiouridylase mnmA [Candidatus Vecturithrix granuli]|uniref:tRNA-specific 2-thiouridylase MnmA n=1 Tax=Vecturithrix granuli TaxID=1499967 RepID=A0A081BYW2_VECG1|nr:tRNA-specific 2-thiouridylase mnmA [Candidatus Vecturithrix granuli]